MNILPTSVSRKLAAAYRAEHGLPLFLIAPPGTLHAVRRVLPADWPILQEARRHALQEAVRWGEPYTTHLAPGILHWVVPVVDGETVRGGLTAGGVRIAEDAENSLDAAVAYLIQHGATRREALAFATRLPVLRQEQVRAAAGGLHDDLYAGSGLRPYRLWRNRDNAQQQRMIGEAIQDRKSQGDPGHSSLDQERMLLSLIRVGDRNAARGLLNDMLAGLFLHSPRTPLIKARVLELMGY